jgi:hypothetical protein
VGDAHASDRAFGANPFVFNGVFEAHGEVPLLVLKKG